MQLIDQLNDAQTRAYAKYCFEKKTVEELRSATHETPDSKVLDDWELTEGQYAEAIATAFAELEA